MTPATLTNAGRKKTIDAEKKRAALKAMGSVKLKHDIDLQEICREVRGKK